MGSNSAILYPNTNIKNASAQKPANTLKLNNDIRTSSFNPDEISLCLRRIQSIYNEMIFSFLNYTNTFIRSMSYCWASIEATNYFHNIFSPAFNDYLLKIDKSMENIFYIINQSASTLSIKTKTTYIKVKFIRYQRNKITADIIKENLNGAMGIIPEDANKNVENLFKISSILNDNLTKMINVLRNSCFKDYGQQNALIQNVNNVKNKINDNFTSLVIEVKKQITITISNHQDTAQKMASMFSSIN